VSKNDISIWDLKHLADANLTIKQRAVFAILMMPGGDTTTVAEFLGVEIRAAQRIKNRLIENLRLALEEESKKVSKLDVKKSLS
jgi:hypothetical protein